MNADSDLNEAMGAIHHALMAYYQMARALNDTLNTPHSPVWWTQLLMLGALEMARQTEDDGKLSPQFADNLRAIIDVACAGRPLYAPCDKAAPEIQPTHSGTERVQ